MARAVLDHANPHVREQMGRNPLLLTILAQVYTADPEAGLPARRADLYYRAQQQLFTQRRGQWGGFCQGVERRRVGGGTGAVTGVVAKPPPRPTHAIGSWRRWCKGGWKRRWPRSPNCAGANARRLWSRGCCKRRVN